MKKISFVLNHQKVEVELDPSTRLLDVLRLHFHLTSVKEGCGEGACGACSVIVDGECWNSCLTPLANVEGKEIITLDAFRETKQYRIIADAFAETGGSQCGFCTPGMILNSYVLLKHNPHPTEEEIRFALSGNLCRCTGYNAIVKAVLLASEMGGDIEW